MLTETRKIQLIESVIKEKSEVVLVEIQNILNKTKNKKTAKKFSAHQFLGAWSEKDAALIEKAIENSTYFS